MIEIRIGKAKKVIGEHSALLSFPYNPDIIKRVKKCRKRWYHPDTKEWEVSTDELEDLIERFAGFPYRIMETDLLDELEDEIDEVEAIPEDYDFKVKPFNHQLEGIEYGLANPRFLLADEQGIGKTYQAMHIMGIREQLGLSKKCLVICCVNGLKYNWQNEIAKTSDYTGYILGTRYRNNGNEYIGSIKDRLEDLKNLPDDYFIITNIETLRDKDVAKELSKLIDTEVISGIIVDEIHKMKNPSTKQAKGVLKLQPKYRIALTGTPLLNSPMDAFVSLKWLGYESQPMYRFKQHYCVMEGYMVVGHKNMPELRDRLDEIMIRRRKSEVLDLPPKIRSIDYVEMGAKQKKIYGEVYTALVNDIDKVRVSPNPLAQLIRLRQATGHTSLLSSTIAESAKLERLEDILEEVVENNDKAIVFSNWTGMTDEVVKRFKKYNPAVVTGQVKGEEREAEQKRFMEDDSCKIIVGTIGAMGTGLTLTAASTVVFLDSPWNFGTKEQAEDRAYRIGTTKPVNVITLVCKNTIDERIESLVNMKGEIADFMVDGNNKVSDETLFFLLDLKEMK